MSLKRRIGYAPSRRYLRAQCYRRNEYEVLRQLQRDWLSDFDENVVSFSQGAGYQRSIRVALCCNGNVAVLGYGGRRMILEWIFHNRKRCWAGFDGDVLAIGRN